MLKPVLSFLAIAAMLAAAATATAQPYRHRPGPPPPRMCGGIAGLRCAPGQYCSMQPGRCTIADGAGVCAPRPRICPRIYRPVCGCNRQTYANSCEAAAAGVNVLYQGRCRWRR